MKILNYFKRYIPFKKNYTDMVHNICIEVAEKKVEKIFFALPQSERDELYLKCFKSHFGVTKSD